MHINHRNSVNCNIPSIDDSSTPLLVQQTVAGWNSAGGRQGGTYHSRSAPHHHGKQNSSQSVQRMVHLHLSLCHQTKKEIVR